MDGGFLGDLQWGWRRKLPVILQTEAAECGLASLAMIARYHGHDVDLPSLRRWYSMSLKGVNLARVMETAAKLGFETRPLRLELDELPELKTPCVLHWDLNHFVVLKRATAHGAVIHDPARGVLKLSNDEVSKHFTGVAPECTPCADFKPIKARESISLRALTGKVNGLPNALVQIFVLALALEVFALVGPFYLQWVLDQVLVSADKSLLMLLGIGFLLVALFQSVISAVRAWTITWLGAMLNVQWITNVFSHLLKWNAPLPDAGIEVRNVSFRYADGEPWILKNCSLTIPAGESVALIGPSGCGKTTLAKVILGLLEPQEGEIMYGGIDIRRLGLGRYRNQIGAVMQDDQLFAGSIADNIACFDSESSSLRIEAAARLAAIHDEITAMPMGYQSLVGDMGSALSGRQKQRVLLARALYRKPKLLVLDEATSHLDIERKRQVNAAVSRLAITRIVIAHRPETIASAQCVVVMENGAVQPIPPQLHEVDVAG